MWKTLGLTQICSIIAVFSHTAERRTEQSQMLSILSQARNAVSERACCGLGSCLDRCSVLYSPKNLATESDIMDIFFALLLVLETFDSRVRLDFEKAIVSSGTAHARA